jgi:tRNA 2-selenouridine synthase
MKSANTVENYLQIMREDIPILDVRAEVEYADGSIPSAMNAPILNNDERSSVGTCYKAHGQQAAVKLGHEIVQGENKNMKLNRWIQFLEKNSNTYITCFRGGLRSQIAQSWLLEKGFDVPRLKNGYKGFRAWALQQLELETNKNTLKVVAGMTGSGKTLFLQQQKSLHPMIDLEYEANHRGSAFGNLGQQPSQSDFEHRILKKFFKIDVDFQKQGLKKPILIEDESRLIGQRALPVALFNLIRSSPVLLIEEPLESRALHIFENYVLNQPEKPDQILGKYIQNTIAISKKLGSERAKEVIADIQNCRVIANSNLSEFEFKNSNLKWIEKLLLWYYDPMYTNSLEKRKPSIEFSGTKAQLKDYLNA